MYKSFSEGEREREPFLKKVPSRFIFGYYAVRFTSRFLR